MMKKLTYLIVAGFIFVFSACGGGASTEEAATEATEVAPAAAEAQDSANLAAEEAEAVEAEDAGDGN
tara:strand:- start:301 stop:501 length:201 start_codon:yes stop_codon:yes gene_type:complete